MGFGVLRDPPRGPLTSAAPSIALPARGVLRAPLPKPTVCFQNIEHSGLNTEFLGSSRELLKTSSPAL